MTTPKVVCRHYTKSHFQINWLIMCVCALAGPQIKTRCGPLVPSLCSDCYRLVQSSCVETDTLHLRLLVDILLIRLENNKDAPSEGKNFDDSEVETIPCWWLSSAASALELDFTRKQVV
eukprot:959428_1